MDRGSKGVQSIAMTGDQTLTWTNYVATNTGQCAVLLLTGSLSSAANLVVPSVEWQWDLIKNSTGQTITVKTSAGSGVAIANGQYMAVYCDASDCYNGSPTNLPGAVTVAGKISGVTAGTATTDAVNKTQMETAIATASLPATAGTVLLDSSDPTAGYLVEKLGQVTAELKTASFVASLGGNYSFPVGGTVTLPAATASQRAITLSPFGAGVTTLSGTINGLSTFLADGDQTFTIKDVDVTRGFV